MKSLTKLLIYKRIMVFIVVAAISGISLYSIRLSRPYTGRIGGQSWEKLGTFVSVKIYGDNRELLHQAESLALSAIDQVDKKLSTWRNDTEMGQVNLRAAHESMPVSPETWTILNQGIEYSKITNGAFDITITPLISLWKESAKNNQLPIKEEIEALPIGWEWIDLSKRNHVSFRKPGIQLNLDAYVKGYAVDKAIQAIKTTGIEGALVNIGGEIACYGPRRNDFYWTLGIQDPFAVSGENDVSETAGWIIRVNNCSVATSGNYRHYFTIQDKHYSHIIDPRTGYPATLLPSVTVIAPDTMTADALATAISVMGTDAGIQLIEKMNGVEAFLIAGTNRDNMQIVQSSGFDKYLIH